jgi:hypothetical protein
MKVSRKFSWACAVLFLLAANARAKRIPPKPVPPVLSGTTQYAADGDGRDEYVVATEASSGNVLWKVKVFHNHFKIWIEEDVQWVYITDLKLVDDSLLVRDERSRCYSVDLKKKRVRKRQCDGVFER